MCTEINELEWSSWLKCGATISFNDSTQLISFGESEFGLAPHSDKPSYYVPEFFGPTDRPWLTFQENRRIPVGSQMVRQVILGQKEPPVPLSWSATNKNLFERHFQFAKSQLSCGEIRKIVLTTCRHTKATEDVLQWMSGQLLNVHANLYNYGFWNQHDGFWGKTPEFLARKEGQKDLETMALAGTASHNLDSIENFVNDPKERHEHQLVVADISARFPGCVQAGDLRVLEIPPLMHLKTPIRIKSPMGATDIVDRLHPTSALGVMPREKLDLLKSVSPDRRRFGAPFGVHLAPDNWLILVAIRNLEKQGDQLVLTSGCGVVEPSEMEREWQELQKKQQSVLQLFQLEGSN